MNTQEKVRLVVVSVVASVLLALAGGVALYKAFGPKTVYPLRKADDDAPIIMAGGSLYIGNHPDFSFSQDSADRHLLKYSQIMQVFQVDVSYFDAAGNAQTASTRVNAAGSVSLNYCKPAGCGGGNSDTVTLAWDAGNNITIRNTWGTTQKLSLLLPNLRVHAHKKWVPVTITGAGGASSLSTLTCNDAECNVVVHTCNVAVTCKDPIN